MRCEMIFVMSDIHGCYEKYIKMLKTINLQDEDTLYILGDVVDRGEDGIKILQDMMNRQNIIPMLGNHEFMAYSVLKKLNVEIDEKNCEGYLKKEDMESYTEWIFNGGLPTAQAFARLTKDEKEAILDYLSEFELYEEISAGGNDFVLVHAGFEGFSESKELWEYDLHEMLWCRCEYEKQYFHDKFLVTGHTPTFTIDSAYEGKIYRKNNHIAIDCGAVKCDRLGCICLDTLEEFYV